MGNCVRLLIQSFNPEEIKDFEKSISSDPSVKRWGDGAIKMGYEAPFGTPSSLENFIVINGINTLEKVYEKLKQEGFIQERRV